MVEGTDERMQMSDLDALVRRIARHEFPDPRTRGGGTVAGAAASRPRGDGRASATTASSPRNGGAPATTASAQRSA